MSGSPPIADAPSLNFPLSRLFAVWCLWWECICGIIFNDSSLRYTFLLKENKNHCTKQFTPIVVHRKNFDFSHVEDLISRQLERQLNVFILQNPIQRVPCSLKCLQMPCTSTRTGEQFYRSKSLRAECKLYFCVDAFGFAANVLLQPACFYKCVYMWSLVYVVQLDKFDC